MEEIKKLSDYEHARIRTPMYLGSTSLHTQEIMMYRTGNRLDSVTPVMEEMTWVPAIYTAYREILDNAMDEINHGYGNRVDVHFKPETDEFIVQDNGRGIPIDKDTKHKMYKPTLVLSHARAGRNFGERGEIAGTNGIGASIVNFCSKTFKVEIWREGKKFTQVFKEGPTKQKIGKPTIKDATGSKTGTKITLVLSDMVFYDKTMPEDFLYSRVYEIALCNPLIKIYWNGKRIKVRPLPESSLFIDKPIIIEIKEGKFRSKYFLKPDFQEKDETVHSIVNNIPAFNGGVHVEQFRRLFYSGMLNALSAQSKRRKLEPNRSDINKGLLIYNITNMSAPDFDSQSKTRLINESVAKIIKKELEDPKLFKNIISKNSDWIDSIFERCSDRTQKKDDNEVKRENKKKLRGKVPELTDAAGKDRSKCILFLGEGDSAVSGIPPVRDPEVHGILGLRGKIMNVNGESPKNVLNSASLSSVITAIGLIIGQKMDRSALNYGKVYIATDADPDGMNIAALLINFFYTYWPELFDKDKEPVFYIFNTPFIIARKGKTNKYWYSYNYGKFDHTKYKGWEITRAKGLAALSEEDWKYSIEYPDLYPVLDDGNMIEALDLIFSGIRAEDRREWIGLHNENLS